MKVTMVKKRLADGSPCPKCVQAEELLKRRNLWGHIDEVVWAVEAEPGSHGMREAARLGVELAPFFVVNPGGEKPVETVYTSVLKLIKERLQTGALEAESSSRADLSEGELGRIAEEMSRKAPGAILKWGSERFGATGSIAFSGAEDVVLIAMMAELGLSYSVFCLDTGRLHPETYEFIERVRSHYGVSIDFVMPEREAVETLVRKKGLFSFYDDGHSECCGVRKVAGLKRHLKAQRAWVTGQRRDQSPTRSELSVVELDGTHYGVHGPLVKLNPLANWTLEQTWSYIRVNEVPYNALHDRGFISIGCAPCTRSIAPGEHERSGRWWWEEATKRECGLHIKN